MPLFLLGSQPSAPPSSCCLRPPPSPMLHFFPKRSGPPWSVPLVQTAFFSLLLPKGFEKGFEKRACSNRIIPAYYERKTRLTGETCQGLGRRKEEVPFPGGCRGGRWGGRMKLLKRREHGISESSFHKTLVVWRMESPSFWLRDTFTMIMVSMICSSDESKR